MSRIFTPRQSETLQTGIGAFEYELFHVPASERDSGSFPANVRRQKRRGTYLVEYDRDAADDLNRIYASEALRTDAVELLYIGAGIIDRVVFERASVMDEKTEDVLFGLMSSSDELGRQILDTSSEDDILSRRTLHYLHDELSPQIHRINGLRFAARALIAGNPEKLSDLTVEAFPHLSDRFLHTEPQFINLARIFTNDVFQAREIFAETVPLHEIAFSFPMSTQQFEAVADLL